MFTADLCLPVNCGVKNGFQWESEVGSATLVFFNEQIFLQMLIETEAFFFQKLQLNKLFLMS